MVWIRIAKICWRNSRKLLLVEKMEVAIVFEYSSAGKEKEPTEDILKWWRDRAKGFSKLVPMVQDILAMQASSVASEDVFSAAKFQLGEHRHSLATDNLEISILFRDWINAERRNLGREPLSTKFQYNVDEVMQDYSDDGIEAMENLSIQPIPEHVTKEMLNDLRRDLYGGTNY